MTVESVYLHQFLMQALNACALRPQGNRLFKYSPHNCRLDMPGNNEFGVTYVENEAIKLVVAVGRRLNTDAIATQIEDKLPKLDPNDHYTTVAVINGVLADVRKEVLQDIQEHFDNYSYIRPKNQ